MDYGAFMDYDVSMNDGSSEESDIDSGTNQLSINRENSGENQALVLFNPDNTRQISLAGGSSRSLVTSAKGKEPRRPKKKVKNIKTPSQPPSSNLSVVRRVFNNVYASALFGRSSAPESSSSHPDTPPRNTHSAEHVSVEDDHIADTEPLTSRFGSSETGRADLPLLRGAEESPVQNSPSQRLPLTQDHNDTDQNNNPSSWVGVVDAKQQSRSESTMRGARRNVTFASHVQIMPMEDVCTTATEPAASSPDSSESDSAITMGPVPFTNHNLPIPSHSGNSGSEVDDTDWTENTGTEPPSRRERTFVPASKDDLDAVSTRLSRIETQITGIRTVVESRRSPSHNGTVYDAADDADTEENSSPRPFKKTGPPKHRSRKSNKFHELIREHARILMKRDDDDTAFTGVILPHEPLLTGFNPRRGACCTVENFTVDILGTPKSQWNISATKIFTNDFIAHHPNFGVDMVMKAFAAHLRSLKRAFKRTRLDDAALKERQKDDRRKERKRSLYHRRLDMARRVSDLRHHVQMLSRLGPDGMSSDETANESGTPQYRILGRHWRSTEVTPWLRTFDAMYRHNRWGPASTVSRGNNARMRFESMSMGCPRGVVSRLPRNAYRAEWYDSLDQYDRDALGRCDNEVYAFTHVPEIQLATQRTNSEPSNLRHYV